MLNYSIDSMKTILSLILAMQLVALPLYAQQPIIAGSDQFPVTGKREPVKAKQGMVVASEPLAAKEALKVLKKGGNAVDAAVTLGLVLAVTLPRAGNLGGGGFMLIAKKNGRVAALDFREKAPLAATEDMFLDSEGNPNPDKSRFSALASGVPGTVAGMHLALLRYGTISWPEALAPAIRLAEEGFLVSEEFAIELKRREEMLKKWPSTEKIFFNWGKPYQAGDNFKQPDLAKTLRLLAKEGPDAFYKGEIAERIVRQMEKTGGLITMEDLKLYYPALRRPIRGVFREHEILSMGPPSSGGTHVIQILNILENYKLRRLGQKSARHTHYLAEAMKYAYADRAKYMGDMDFVRVPLTKLTSQSYANRQKRRISSKRATPSKKIYPQGVRPKESTNTTHYSIVDHWGNAVSTTTTLNFSFGNGMVVDGTGFLLNNQMDDFSAKPGTANAYGLIGSKANKIEPKKRMLSSMSPTIVRRRGQVVLVTGSPGGSRIISTTTQVILNVLEHRMNIQQAVDAPRMHHQWMPDLLRLEEGFDEKTIDRLKSLGHKVEISRPMGAAQSIYRDKKGRLFGASDPRRGGLAIGY